MQYRNWKNDLLKIERWITMINVLMICHGMVLTQNEKPWYINLFQTLISEFTTLLRQWPSYEKYVVKEVRYNEKEWNWLCRKHHSQGTGLWGGCGMRLLEEFWYGNIEPTEYDTSSCKEYIDALLLIAENEEKLLATMTDEQKDLFSRYTDVVRECQTMTECLLFQNSFKLGARMMIEVLEE